MHHINSHHSGSHHIGSHSGPHAQHVPEGAAPIPSSSADTSQLHDAHAGGHALTEEARRVERGLERVWLTFNELKEFVKVQRGMVLEAGVNREDPAEVQTVRDLDERLALLREGRASVRLLFRCYIGQPLTDLERATLSSLPARLPEILEATTELPVSPEQRTVLDGYQQFVPRMLARCHLLDAPQ